MDDSFREAFLKNLIYFNTFDASADESLLNYLFKRLKSFARTQMLHQKVFYRSISRHFDIFVHYSMHFSKT